MLRLKVDTGAQENILPLRIYGNMFPNHLDENGFPTGTKPTQAKLTAFNGTTITQHGICSIKCSYDDNETVAEFYVTDVNGPMICGLPTSCKLKLVELHCEITTNTNKASCKASAPVNDKGDLQMLYPDLFNGISKFEGEYHIVTDPSVLPKPKPTQAKLTAFNGTTITQHGICSIKCSYDDNETVAEFYVTDVNGPMICGLPTSCKLKLVELHCEITTNTNKASCKASAPVNDKGDLQMLYPDLFNGISKFEGEYHIVTDPSVLPVIHAPRKCPIHIKDDIKKELDEMVSLGVIKPVTEPSDWVSSVAYSQKSNVTLHGKTSKKVITRARVQCTGTPA